MRNYLGIWLMSDTSQTFASSPAKKHIRSLLMNKGKRSLTTSSVWREKSETQSK